MLPGVKRVWLKLFLAGVSLDQCYIHRDGDDGER